MTSPDDWNFADIFKCLFWREITVFWLELRLVLHGLLGNTSALVQVMAWGCMGDKPWPKPMMTKTSPADYSHLNTNYVNIGSTNGLMIEPILIMLRDVIWCHPGHNELTQWGRVVHICIIKLMAPSHYLKQWWNIVNWNLGNKFQWNSNRNTTIFHRRK